MKAMVADRLGGPEVLQLRDVPDPIPAAGEVLIEVVRAGVNFADLLAVGGRYAAAPQPPFVPGLEVSGMEADSGRPVVALLRSGGFAERVAADSRFVFDGYNMDLMLAGGWPLVTITAHYALVEMARMRAGEHLLVTAGAGGLGSTLIQVARALGAGRVVAMASTTEKREFAIRNGAHEAIGYDDPIPPVDVVVDGVGGAACERALEAVRPLGRVVVLGVSSGTIPAVPPFDTLRRRNVGVLGFSLGMLRIADPERAAALARPAVELLRTGIVSPPVGRTLPLDHAGEALRMLGARESMGKLLLAP